MPDTYLHLFWGYTVFFLCIALYVVLLGMEQRRLAARARRIEEELSRLSSTPASKAAVG